MMSEQYGEAEVHGRYVASFIESAGEVSPVFERKVREIFDNHISGEITYDEWYPISDVSDAFHRVLREVGESTMREGGAASARQVPWPEEVTAVSDGLQRLDQMHQDSSRGGTSPEPAGSYTIDIRGDRSARVAVTEDWPYTAPEAEGVLKGVVDSLGDERAVPTINETDTRSGELAAWDLSW